MLKVLRIKKLDSQAGLFCSCSSWKISDLAKASGLAFNFCRAAMWKRIVLMIPEGTIKINKKKLETSVSIQYISGITFFKTYTQMCKRKKSNCHYLIFLKFSLTSLLNSHFS